ncbi:XrtB/PEP-CTERM-associated transcriptional regulator EpsA [Massilia sp. 9096]|uniref:XrtB/PEP-CTERM-associated transcriptional regulator EpsA n=1 Tax=Massilia sp. 9096 TaxID=1500894 RepID=UPI000565E4EA|nr:XrtB/PEP-CTERM-associated transcriptional regulator EpsA [Massilia sp. 9096]
MEPVVILSRQEQEYLLRVIEAGVRAAGLHGFFLWTQGQLQALLPHQVLVAMQFAPGGNLQRLECVHGTVLDAAALALLTDARDGLAPRLARHCLQGGRLPALGDFGGAAQPGLEPFRAELGRAGFDNLLVHGTGQTAGGASVFALFGLPQRPSARHAYFLELLVPHLHLALMRLPSPGAGAAAPARPLSTREAEIMGWLREGKSNDEMGQILGISALTVKNHLQRIYRLLGVSNRAHALARCIELRLLEGWAAG